MYARSLTIICALLSVLTLGGVNEKKLIEALKVSKNKIIVIPNKEFKRAYLTDNFFAEYETDIDMTSFDYSMHTMPFIMNVISIIWISGGTYYVDEMDAELYYSLQRVKKVFQLMYPRISWNGDLVARTLKEHKNTVVDDPQKTALLFSGGVDSTSSSFAHLDKKQLLITAWGHWDLPLKNTELWTTHKARTIQFAQQYGHQTAFIKSNYSAFLNWKYLSSLAPEISKWRLGAVEGLGWAGLTAPILLSKGYNVLRIASSHTWLYPYPSAASPYIDNNIRFFGSHLLHDQYEYTRSAKIQFIVQMVKEKKLRKPFLKVCSYEKKQDRNCCACRKCVSSIMGFFVLGEDPKGYGMPIDFKTASERFKKLIAPTKLNAYTILYCKGLQKNIRNRIQAGEKLQKELLQLASINFDTKQAIEEGTQQKISWKEMRTLLPELSIPEFIDEMPVIIHKS